MAVDLVTVGMKRTDDGDLVRDPDEQLTAEELNAIVVALNEGITAGNDHETIIADLRTSLGLTGPLAVPGDETVTAAIDRIDAALVASINDGTVSDASAWSSEKVETEIGAAITALVGAAPETLNTLQELAALLQSEAGLIDALQTIAQSNTDAIAEVRQDFEAADAIHTTGISDNANDIAQVRTDFEAADAILAADIAQARTDFEAADATHTANIATNAAAIATHTANISTNATNISTNAAAIATNATNISTNGADIATARTDFEAADAVHTADIAALVTRVLALEEQLIETFSLTFNATSSLIHRFDTVDAAPYTATYPDGSVETIASGATHTQTLPAGTSGAVEFVFAGGVTSVTQFLTGNSPWSFDLSALSPMTSTTFLYINGNTLTVSGNVSALSPLTSLTHLQISGHAMTVSGDLSSLSPLTSLTTLYLLGAVLTISGNLSALSPLTSLTYLRVDGHTMTITGDLAALSPLTSLTTVYLIGNAHTIGGDLSGLSPLTSLTYLQFLGSTMTVSGNLSALSPLTSLTYLYINGTSMTPSGDGTFLSSMSALTQLYLISVNLPSSTVDGIINTASTMPLLMTIHLNGTNGSRTAASDAGAALITGRGANFLYNGRALYNLYTDQPAWLVAAYDFGILSSLALSNGNVVQANDQSGNGLHATQVVAAQQPPYLASDARANGLAAVGAQTNLGILGVETPAVSASRAYVSTAYKGGAAAVFDEFAMLIGGDGVNSTYRVMGESGSNRLRSGNDFAHVARVNGAAESEALLPLKLSTLVLTSPVSRFQKFMIGSGPLPADRTWPGPIRRCCLSDGAETDADRDKVEGFSAWRDGTQADLDPAHPYRNAPPLA